jgi:hypothetical protein
MLPGTEFAAYSGVSARKSIALKWGSLPQTPRHRVESSSMSITAAWLKQTNPRRSRGESGTIILTNGDSDDVVARSGNFFQ